MSGPSPARTVVIGIDNEFRRDDGAGPAVIGRLCGLAPPGIDLMITDGEPTRLIDGAPAVGAALEETFYAEMTVAVVRGVSRQAAAGFTAGALFEAVTPRDGGSDCSCLSHSGG